MILVQQAAATQVGRRYFDGSSPLFPDVADVVADQVAEVERVITLYNEHVNEGSWRPKRRRVGPLRIDLGQLRAASEPAVQAQISLTVDLAKAEAWRLIGERERGYPLIERHVWRDEG